MILITVPVLYVRVYTTFNTWKQLLSIKSYPYIIISQKIDITNDIFKIVFFGTLCMLLES